jgi:hypothetical protein
MFLSSVECQGYKAFSAPTGMDLRRLTVIFGRNNSGKTTLARLPLFAAASFADIDHGYALSVGDIRFGSSFTDLASGDQPHPSIRFRLAWQPTATGVTKEALRSLELELQYVAAGVEQHSVQLRKLAVDDESPKFYELTKTTNEPAQRSIILNRLRRDERTLILGRSFEMRRLARDTIHIPSGRARIESTYATREPNAWTVGEVPYLLATNDRLAAEVANWYRKSLNGINIDVDLAAFAFRVVEIRDTVALSLSESGRGTQAVLPVVALLLGVAMREQRARLVVVEEPEEHLHPSAHGAVGDLLITACRNSQVIVETHSENLILRLRRRIAQRQLHVDDVAFYYVDDNHEVVPISIDNFGIAENWPAGVFEGDAEEASDIVEAKLAAMGKFGTPE